MTEVKFSEYRTLHEVETDFNLTLNEDRHFFWEWQRELPELTSYEISLLDQVKTGYVHRTKFLAMLENSVQITVVSPLLLLSKFLLPPFLIQTETSTQITIEDEDMRVEGRIDILMLKDKFWALVIESKRAALSTQVAFPQILSYMVANPTPDKPCFGLVTNGSSFVFFKVVMGEVPQYGMSRMFDFVNPGNDLYDVLKVLKKIRQLS